MADMAHQNAEGQMCMGRWVCVNDAIN